jgi:hypothetical protein
MTGPHERQTSGGTTQENAMNREQINRRNPIRQRPVNENRVDAPQAPVSVEPLEGRRMMSTNVSAAPSTLPTESVAEQVSTSLISNPAWYFPVQKRAESFDSVARPQPTGFSFGVERE